MNRRSVFAAPFCLIPALVAPQPSGSPNPSLAAVQGAWRGSLTYRDYSRPDRLVTLPARLFIALSAPSELALHYVFDDGPNKTVYSYERMAFDFANDELTWTSGVPPTRVSRNRITSSQAKDEGRLIAFEREDQGSLSRYVLNLQPKTLSIAKEEGSPSAGFQFRNKYEFTRSEA